MNHTPEQTNPFQENADRAVELDELDFSDDPATPTFVDLTPQDIQVDDEAALAEDNIGLTQAETIDMNPTDDDVTPETLIHEDGARSPYEPGSDEPFDESLTIVDESEIGGGVGLDEAELARVNPLDGKPWDGAPGEPLNPEPPYEGDVPGPEEEIINEEDNE